MSSNRNLLEKYNIPISHLDYGYIDECTNTKEVEKIVAILRSGQEGYFPDLTRRAEEKLRSLNPQSKILRTESSVLTKSGLTPAEWKEVNEPVVEWINDIRQREIVLTSLPGEEKDTDNNIPAVREVTGKFNPTVQNVVEPQRGSSDRIKSTEYTKWDKYDADTEELKIDLADERVREEIERKNRLNLKKCRESKKTAINERDVDKLPEIERENLALKYKDRGNEYFRAKEFTEAIWEYTQCIKVLPLSVHGYNNRALVYLKNSDFQQCIDDCNSCLEIDPRNIKALLRKAQAYLGLDKRREAYDVYAKIVSVEPDNITAKKQIKDLQKQLPGLPPISATRIRIIEESSENSNTDSKSTKADSENITKILHQQKVGKKPISENIVASSVPPKCDDDFSKLIVPKKIVKSKLKAAVETLGHIQKETKTRIQKAAQKKNEMKPEVDIFAQSRNIKANAKLIEEI